ncbi:hypothetical protein Br6_04820 [Rhodococcus sp. Br-6]|nr:hypothetical protein Br6_04820 [Rhodococcus sp. Br-6]
MGPRPMGREEWQRLCTERVDIDRSSRLYDRELDEQDLDDLGDRFDEIEREPVTNVMLLFGQILYLRHRDQVVIPLRAVALDSVRCRIIRSREPNAAGQDVDLPKSVILQGIPLGIRLPDRYRPVRD